MVRAVRSPLTRHCSLTEVIERDEVRKRNQPEGVGDYRPCLAADKPRRHAKNTDHDPPSTAHHMHMHAISYPTLH